MKRLLIASLLASQVQAAEVIVSWDASTSSDVASYETVITDISNPQDVTSQTVLTDADTTRAIFPSINPGVYVASVFAINDQDMPSEPASVEFSVPFVPAAVNNVTVTVTTKTKEQVIKEIEESYTVQ